MSAPIIQTNNLSRTFADKTAVSNLSLQVEKGTIFGLIGANGAGKTTTVRMLTTLLKISSGSATVNGFDVEKEAAQVRGCIGYVPQEAHADEALTGREHLILQGRLYGMQKDVLARRIDEVLRLVGLEAEADRRALKYSSGMRKLLDVAVGLLHSPSVLFVDEPTTGVDIARRQQLMDYFRSLPSREITVFLTSHFLDEIDQLAHHVAILDQGQIIAEGAPGKLKSQIGSSVFDITFMNSNGEGCKHLRLSLNSVRGIAKVMTVGTGLKVFANEEDEVLRQIKVVLNESNYAVKSLSVSRPSLNDVFYYFTDRGSA